MRRIFEYPYEKQNGHSSELPCALLKDPICMLLLLMTIMLLCHSKGPSAVCQQNFMTALTTKYLYGLSSIQSNFVGTLDVACNAMKTPNIVFNTDLLLITLISRLRSSQQEV